ncbi:MAG: hypothetical protein F9K40_01240, partial [Kofleriaceae bacterium]
MSGTERSRSPEHPRSVVGLARSQHGLRGAARGMYQGSSMRRSPGTTHAYWLVGIVAATTVVVLLGFHQLARERDAMRFRNATEAVQDSIRARLDAHVAILLATRGQVASDPDGIDVHSFRTFVGYLDLPARYPGILGVGFTRRLRPHEVEAAVAETIAHGQVPFRVWPAEPRDEVHAILFLEPLDRRNQAALGYDMFTDPVRREAMARARDTGEPAASGKVTLVQEIDDQKQAGFLIYVPVYEGGARPSTLDERREKLVGFVYSPFRMEDLLRGVFGTQAYPRIAFDIYDGPQVQPEALMHRGVVRAPDAPRARSVVQMDIAGRPWSIDMRSTAAFAASSTIPVFPWLVGLAVLLNVAFCVAMYAQVRARRREDAARQRLAVLADSSQRFSEAQLDLPLVLRTITRELAHRLGDSCTINLVDETGAFLELAETCHVDPAAETSLRELLAREKDLDAVYIMTPDHLHATIALAAMRVGKHVITHKPLGNVLREAQIVIRAARETGAATHMFCASGLESTAEHTEWLDAGTIGPVREVHNWSNRPYWPQGMTSLPAEAVPVPEGLDWDLWLGPVPHRPYHPAYTNAVFRGWYDFCTGALGDMGHYSFFQVFKMLRLGSPLSVEASRSQYWRIEDLLWKKQTNAVSYPQASLIRWEFPERQGLPPVTLHWYDG